ncbi:hypothetical protein QBC33DRAFT_596589 [Phialemonium atrogriseum]|uniref:PD-(D/E)XK nuclease-like domain-containing protein n=1 Tax=Phialemonium atrogriseum TaxID=1093897 RepID=A0AAJ0BSX3_9PEZI|nr:uncharacterized protein QBC33DRAFT_596589 [Phialemonium atrogriseum]KAK1763850.1 hypothetical protein QBC33DRAFT_596589 [Phialemonium atrogriseum]
MPIPDAFFAAPTTDTDDRDRLWDELSRVREILADAKECLEWCRAEAAWNTLVHLPILKLALRGRKDVSHEMITTASILEPYLPTDPSTNLPVSSKMVDFALLLEPARDSSPLRSALESLVRSLPLDHKSINATAYGKLQVCPAPVAIETKLGSVDEDEAKAQVGIWVAAWFARMSLLCGEGEGGAGVISVPVLLISGTTWSMYHASDSGDAVV